MFDRGWGVFVTEIGGLMGRDGRRRTLVVASSVTVAAAALLVVLGLTTAWPDLPGDVAGVVVLALGVGVCSAALVPLRPSTPESGRLYWSGSQMQGTDRVERYLRRGPAPTIATADRDAVLREGRTIVAGLVPDVWRGVVISAAVLVTTVALVLLDVHVPAVAAIAGIAVVRSVLGVNRLGRVRRAMDVAESMPASPDPSTSPSRGRRQDGTTSGSAIRLPGE